MGIKIQQGIEFHTKKTVEYKDTAANYGSGLVEVFATPAMIGLMENTALKSVEPHLPEGYTTVGMEVCIKHLKATPIGMKVTCHSILEKVEGKKLYFNIEAHDKDGKIGEGTHKRYIINNDKFMQMVKGE